MTLSTVDHSDYPTYTGQCYCGLVQFTLTGPHQRTDFCHCSECRLSTGGTARLNGKWRRSQLQVTAGEQCIQSWPNSRSKQISFCQECGITLWRSNIKQSPTASDNVYSVYLPTLHQCGNRNINDDSDAQGGYAEWPASLLPTRHIYYTSRMHNCYDRADDGLPKWARLGSDELGDEAQQVQYNERSHADFTTATFDGVKHVECACGAVKATLSSATPTSSVACHCSICRLVCSAEYSIWLIVPQQDLQVVQQGSDQLRTTDIGTAMKLTWCSTCSSPLWLNDDDDKGANTVEIAAQSVVEFSGKAHQGAGYLPSAWQPTAHIQWRHRLARPSWVSDGIPLRTGSSRSEYCDLSGIILADVSKS